MAESTFDLAGYVCMSRAAASQQFLFLDVSHFPLSVTSLSSLPHVVSTQSVNKGGKTGKSGAHSVKLPTTT